ncbi:MAG TPA: thioredoxin family protein [Candidatus Avimonas sp.]|nr:thioredoxin family protein [Clostridiales bacterium]HPU59035.1 thioredoxin family protein [Candidatus Avimonas sp.]
MLDNLVNVSIVNFEKLISSEKPAVLFFLSESYSLQKYLEPIKNLSSKYCSHALFGLVNVEEDKELCNHFGITSLPGVVIIKDGRLRFNSSGEDSIQGCKKAIDDLVSEEKPKSSLLKRLLKTK